MGAVAEESKRRFVDWRFEQPGGHGLGRELPVVPTLLSCPYTPGCVEGQIRELRANGVLRSSLKRIYSLIIDSCGRGVVTVSVCRCTIFQVSS
jgi:hypothetical protein